MIGSSTIGLVLIVGFILFVMPPTRMLLVSMFGHGFGGAARYLLVIVMRLVNAHKTVVRNLMMPRQAIIPSNEKDDRTRKD